MIEQGSPEWLAERCGKATASRFKDVLAVLKSGKPAEARTKYAMQLAAERLTGRAANGFVSEAMKRGTKLEPAAIAEYEWQTGNLCDLAPFIPHPTLLAGASPDRLVGNDGLVEVKCPGEVVHLETWRTGMPAEHMPQVQGQLWITGRRWADFVSYHPDYPDSLRVYVQRVERDEKYIENLETEVVLFLIEVENIVADVQKRAKEG